MKITAVIERIGPDKAATYLNTMVNNRVLNQTIVNNYSSLMAAGLWKGTHQGIAFNEKGELTDGQHRLWGIIESGVTIEMLVVRGIDSDAVSAIDAGRVRNFSDHAHYNGWDANNIEAGIAKILAAGITKRNYYVPPEVMNNWYEFYRNGVTFAMRIRNSVRVITKVPPMGMCAAFAAAWYSSDEATLLRMAVALNTGVRDAPRDNAAIALRDAWLTGRLGGPNSSEQYLKTEGAIRAFIEGRPIRNVQMPEKEIFVIPKLPKDIAYTPKPMRVTTTEARVSKLRRLLDLGQPAQLAAA